MGNFSNLTSVELSGTLSGGVERRKGLKAHVAGVVGDKEVDVELEYKVWEMGKLVKGLFERLLGVLVERMSLPIRWVVLSSGGLRDLANMMLAMNKCIDW